MHVCVPMQTQQLIIREMYMYDVKAVEFMFDRRPAARLDHRIHHP